MSATMKLLKDLYDYRLTESEQASQAGHHAVARAWLLLAREVEAEIRSRKPRKTIRRWHRVPLPELEAIWNAQRRAGTCFNGCTNAALQARYGVVNVRHDGRGWLKLVTR